MRNTFEINLRMEGGGAEGALGIFVNAHDNSNISDLCVNQLLSNEGTYGLSEDDFFLILTTRLRMFY